MVLIDEERKAKVKKYNKKYASQPVAKASKKARSQIPQNKEKRKAEVQKLKKDVFTKYSKRHSNSDIPCCRCCGLNEHLDFLTVDHIDGRKSRPKEEQGLLGANLTRWLRKNNFPDGFQILCFNCNATKGFFGSCPHKRKPTDDQPQDIDKEETLAMRWKNKIVSKFRTL